MNLLKEKIKNNERILGASVCLILICAILLSVTSCSLVDRLRGDMSKLDHTKDGSLLYGGNSYYLTEGCFAVHTKPGDQVTELGWYSRFPFFPEIHYYTFDEDPTFIFCANGESTFYDLGTYIRSDYDIYGAIFTVNDTDIEISFDDAMTKSDMDRSLISKEGAELFQMYLKDDPRILVEVWGPCSYNDKWYFYCSDSIWAIGEELVEILISQGMIDGRGEN